MSVLYINKDIKDTVHVSSGMYATPFYEMEIWTLANENDYSDERYKNQLEDFGLMDCGLCRESVGLFPTKECALEHLHMLYEDTFENDRELFCAFIRQKAMYYMMQPNDYIKEWTYVHGLLLDESIVRNYDEDENPFIGRPQEMIRFQKGDIVMIPDMNNGHWGIVCDTPVTPEYIKGVNERIERETGIKGNKYSNMDWSDDQYTIFTNVKDNMVSLEHIQAHHVLPALHIPKYVRKKLEEGLQTFLSR